jgi:DNA mismatch repair ATPase MutS
VVARAQEILANLERTEFDREGRPRLAQSQSSPPAAVAQTRQLPLFSSEDEGVLDDIRRADLDHLTPMSALSLLAELKKRLT